MKILEQHFIKSKRLETSPNAKIVPPAIRGSASRSIAFVRAAVQKEKCESALTSQRLRRRYYQG
ncbi:MAG: hypothetical protein SOT81_08900 [Treponema sp.]|nr:hypothetical protein [Treponema sp.]